MAQNHCDVIDTWKVNNYNVLINMSDNQQEKVSTWDNPSSKDAFGREPFVETIVKTIQSSEEGFNLGISARWGEGKSSILYQLKPKLEQLNYTVLIFKPWKYTQDKISIKRKFILDIYSQLEEKYDESVLYDTTEQQKELSFLEYLNIIKKRLGVSVYIAVSLIDIILFILILTKYFLIKDIDIFKALFSNLVPPILIGLLPIIQKLLETTIKHTTPKIESAEQFEDLFNIAIKKIMDSEKKPERIIIFVDDLDRCSHVEVEQILTALFTFFNNKNCTYIITADHMVIRRYISKFLQLEDEVDSNGKKDIKKTNETKQKEATEYLKKIFQINFILPRIPNNLLESWVRELIEETTIISFKNPYAKEYLTNLILNNFQGNPRKIKHFIRTLAFQLEAINEKINHLEESNSDEAKNLNKVLKSPELLAKILIIQDRFPDFYEKLISEPKLLQQHEAGLIAEEAEVQTLLAQEPKFFNSLTRVASLKTIDPYYFLYFSGSTGFVELKAVDPAEVKALARNADFEGLTKIINGLTDQPRNEQIEHIKSDYSSSQLTPTEKVNIIRSLIHAISLIEEPTLRLQNLKDLILSTGKYETEFKSLQSIDFEKFIAYADTEVIEHILKNEPFIEIGLQSQIFNGFISKQNELNNGEVTNMFLETLATNIQKNDLNLPTYLSIIQSLNSDNMINSNKIQDILINLYSNSIESLKPELFNTFLLIKNNLSKERQDELESIIVNNLENNPITDTINFLGNIPTIINNTNYNLSRLVSSLIARTFKLNTPELEQLYNILLHPAIKAEISSKELDEILIALVKNLDSTDDSKRNLIMLKLPEIINHAYDKKSIIETIIQYLSTSKIPGNQNVISIIQGMNDFWNTYPDIKKEFINLLKNYAKKTKDKELKTSMIKTAKELLKPNTN
jgi:hypothetical protein